MLRSMRLTSRLSVSLICRRRRGVAGLRVLPDPRAIARYAARPGTAGAHAGRQPGARRRASGRRSTRYDQLQKLVERFKDRETVAGVAAYDAAGTPLAATDRAGSPCWDALRSAVSQALRNGWAKRAILHACGLAHARRRCPAAQRRDRHRRARHRPRHGVYRHAHAPPCGGARSSAWRCRRC